MRELNLTGANLEGANLYMANLTGADLTGADLLGANLEKAPYGNDTQWPEGFDPIEAGALLQNE